MNNCSPDVEAIYFAVREKPPADRAVYLDEVCGRNPELRRRVEQFLSAQVEIGSFLERPASHPVLTIDAPVSERPGTVLGPYKLMEQIGEGGMGLVFVAEQQQPMRRKVALKIIKPGMDSQQVIARFEAERQALALMDHQNIAKVFDAGTTQSGRPYFVMELVHGVPITEYCDANKLTPRERLELFLPVCHAIQHAHQKGIIHRDIKPSNILVTMYDDKPVPKVIDFGVAKAIEQRLTEKTVYTQFGTLVGTFEYMSPEQAEMNAFGVDTRSDIYALGVLLYELLTGTTPLERHRLREAAYGDIVRLIKEEEPPRPSTRLSRSGAALTDISQQRGSAPEQLTELVRGELDWIVMRCLEKDRTRRYETANGLARDVERYLKDEPVEACPPTAGYRLRKFTRKHKAGLATAVGFAALLVLGVAGSTWQAVRATAAQQESRRNEAEAQEQKRQADHAKDRAEKQRDELAALNDRLHHMTYIADMNLARHALEENNLVLARDLLERHRPKPGETDLRDFEWHYLRRLSHGELFTVKAHAGAVGRVAYTPSGRRLVSAGTTSLVEGIDGQRSAHSEIKLWDAASGAPLALRLTGATDKVCGVALSPDGKLLAAGCRDKMVRVWNLETGQLIATLKGHTDDIVLQVAFSPDGKHLASRARPFFQAGHPALGEIRIWDLNARKAIVSINNLSYPAWLPAYSPDGKRLASEAALKVLKVWDAESGRELLVKELENVIAAVAFSPDGKRLAVAPVAGATEGNYVRILNAGTGELVKNCPSDLSACYKLTFSPDGKQLAGAGQGPVQIWNVESGQLVRTFRGHPEGATDIAFSPDGTRLASAGTDSTIKVWETTGRRDTISIAEGKTPFWETILSPDGRIAATGLGQETFQLWSATTGERLGNPLKHEHKVIQHDFTADGNRLALTDEVKNITIWDVTTSKAVFRFKHDGPAGFIPTALSPDGKWFACPGPAGVLKVWDTEKGLELRTLKGLKEPAHFWAFSPDSTRLAAWDAGAFKTWDLATGREIGPIDLKDVYISSLRFSPDGKQLAVVVGRGDPRLFGSLVTMVQPEVLILDAESGREVFPPLKGHAGRVLYLRFSPDGKRLATVGRYGPVRIWDIATGQETLTLKGTGRVTDLAFSPDGRRLISGYMGGTVHIWDATPLPE
jgi:WD40 repeat protein/serine/threonine protein kinase